MHPLAGTWIANIEKSRRHANHQFASATMVFEVTGVDVGALEALGKKDGGRTQLVPHSSR